MYAEKTISEFVRDPKRRFNHTYRNQSKIWLKALVDATSQSVNFLANILVIV